MTCFSYLDAEDVSWTADQMEKIEKLKEQTVEVKINEMVESKELVKESEMNETNHQLKKQEDSDENELNELKKQTAKAMKTNEIKELNEVKMDENSCQVNFITISIQFNYFKGSNT